MASATTASIATAAGFHFAIGAKEVEVRLIELATLLKNGLREAGIELVTPLDLNLSGGVCVVRVPAARSNEIYGRLYEEHGIAGATTGGLRLCPHIYNTREHIDRAIRGVKLLLATE